MKTQILRLESTDDAASIRDKISWVKTPRVLLIFPQRRPPRLSSLDLTLLQRATTQAGGILGLMTQNHDIRVLAAELGIPVFPSIVEAHQLPWRTSRGMRKIRPIRRSFNQIHPITHIKSRTESNWAGPRWLKIGVFVLGVAAFFIIISLFVPSATIEIETPRTTQTETMTVYPIVGFRTVLPNGRIPAVNLKVSVTGSMQAIATGEEQVGDSAATVKLLITNLTDKSVTILPGSLFTAPAELPIQFKSLGRINLPPGPGSTVTIDSEAVERGIRGNVPAGSINSVEGQLGLLVQVTNPEPATGGTSRGRQAASELDYAQLYDKLLTSLTDIAITNLEAQYQENLVILAETMKVDRVAEDVRQPAAGTPADRVQLSLKIDFTTLAVSRDDLKSLAAQVMDPKINLNHYSLPSEYSYTSLSAPHPLAPGRYSWEVEISRELELMVEKGAVKGMIVGAKPPAAQNTIQDYLELPKLPTIKIWPTWWGYLPLLPYRMEVAVN